MKQYELTVMIHPDLEMNPQPALDKVVKLIESVGGKITKETNEGTGCYVLLVNNTSESTIIQNVNPNPVDKSFSYADQAGTYKATVYFTAVAK